MNDLTMNPFAQAQELLSEEIDVDTNIPPPKPDELCFSGLPGEIAKAGSATTEANPIAIVFGFNVRISANVGRHSFLYVGDDCHHANIYGLHVGRSGRGRKGTSTKLADRIFKKIPELASYKDLNLICQEHTGGLSTREGLISLIHDGFSAGKEEIPAIDDKRLFILESEFANVLHQTKRDGNTLSSALRDTWDGRSLSPATKNNKISATDPHIALLGNVTPNELLDLMKSRELTNGFANRFLFFFAERQKLVQMPTPTPNEVILDLAIKTGQVLKWQLERDSQQVKFSNEARNKIESLYPDLNRSFDNGGIIDGLLERLPAYLLRLSMLYSIMDKSETIEERHVDIANSLIRFSRDSVLYIFRTYRNESTIRKANLDAEKIINHLKDKKQGSTRTEISREVFKNNAFAKQIDEAINSLLLATPPKITMTIDGDGIKETKRYELIRN